MPDPLEFLDPILHTLQFGYQIVEIVESSISWLIAKIKWLIANDEKFRNLGLLFAALIGLPFLIWRSYSLDRSSRAAQKQAENAEMQAKNAEKQAENAWKSHVADTYTRAIEQFGAVDNKGEPNLELRLGGLYALEKIANFNDDYHPQIMEVLCAYVRLHCSNKIEDNKKGDTKPRENDFDNDSESLRSDIEACLTVIGRRNKSFDVKKPELIGVYINRATISKFYLPKVNFRDADLSSATFHFADFSGTTFTRANFSKASLISANLTGAYLDNADLSNALLIGVNLTGACLLMANLQGATLYGADLTGAKKNYL